MTLFRAVEDTRPRLVLVALFGMLLGYSLSRMGFTDYGALHAMFTLADLRLIFVFGGGVALSMGAYVALKGYRTMAPRNVHKGTVAGGILFGLGWALCGACPGAAFSMLGEGKLQGVAAVVGILIGARAYRFANHRWFHIGTGACG